MKFLKTNGVLFCSILLIAVLFTACGEKGTGQSSDDGQQTNYFQNGGQSQDDGSTAEPEDLNFDMAPPTTPDFSDLTLTPASSEPLYTFEDGYAYALDPETLQKTGPALDPVTKEPIADAAAPDTAEPETPVDGEGEPEVGEPASADEGAKTEPDESVKLPNTGIFMEDD